jgi:hypothetical protein
MNYDSFNLLQQWTCIVKEETQQTLDTTTIAYTSFNIILLYIISFGIYFMDMTVARLLKEFTMSI